MKNLHEIQGPTTRKKSICLALSNTSWERGFSNFFIDNIPISFSTSKRFANLLTQLCDLIKSHSPSKKRLRMIELGAGLGILSKHILDSLKEKWFNLDSSLLFQITDASSHIVNELKRLPIFKPYKSCVQFKKVDSSTWRSKQPIDLAIAVNLCDSLNAYHIEYNKGKIYELHVSAHIPKDIQFIDTTVMPPRCLGYKEVATLILSKSTHKKRQLLTRLSSYITEKWHRIPLEKSSLSKKERAMVTEFINSINPPSPFQYNFSIETHDFLVAFFKSASPSGIMAIFDFGHTRIMKSKSYNQLISTYGVTIFHSVCFPYLKFIAQKYGFDMYNTHLGKGKSQMCVLYNKKLKKTVRSELKAIFNKDSIMTQIYKNEEIFKTIKTENLKKVKQLYDTLPSDIQKSFLLNLKLSTEYFKKDEIKQANQHSDIIIEQYGLTALPAYNIKMNALYGQKKYEEVLQLYEKLKPFTTYYGDIHNIAILGYTKLGKRKEFMDTAKKCLATSLTQEKIMWNHYILMILISLELKDVPFAKKLVNWVINTNKNHPNLLPKKIVKQTHKIKSLFINKNK